jgi:putative transposase
VSTRLYPGVFYHIYNRGNNRENIFREERNYTYFLHLYHRHITPIAETYAYCLLKNHFHLLIRVKDSTIGETASQKFSNFFNAYSKAINLAYQRSGALFQRPFKRIPVTDNLLDCCTLTI